MHSSLISLIINGLSSQVPLSLLSESFQNVVGAHFHNRDLLVKALVLSIGGGAGLILSNFSITTPGDIAGLQSHILGVLLVGITETTVLVSEGLSLSIGVPVVMGLIMPMILIEGIIQVAIHPGQLGDVPEIEGHLGQFAGLVFVSLPNWVQALV